MEKETGAMPHKGKKNHSFIMTFKISAIRFAQSSVNHVAGRRFDVDPTGAQLGARRGWEVSPALFLK